MLLASGHGTPPQVQQRQGAEREHPLVHATSSASDQLVCPRIVSPAFSVFASLNGFGSIRSICLKQNLRCYGPFRVWPPTATPAFTPAPTSGLLPCIRSHLLWIVSYIGKFSLMCLIFLAPILLTSSPFY
jgi:hypothetical protein